MPHRGRLLLLSQHSPAQLPQGWYLLGEPLPLLLQHVGDIVALGRVLGVPLPLLLQVQDHLPNKQQLLAAGRQSPAPLQGQNGTESHHGSCTHSTQKHLCNKSSLCYCLVKVSQFVKDLRETSRWVCDHFVIKYPNCTLFPQTVQDPREVHVMNGALIPERLGLEWISAGHPAQPPCQGLALEQVAQISPGGF